jgi:hypothetical protein
LFTIIKIIMPKDGEPHKRAKDALKEWCKVRIIKPTPVETHHRPTTRLTWCCEDTGCNKYYSIYRSLQRHKKECHEPPGHRCGCGQSFERLKYLIAHKQRCRKKEVGTQTEAIADQSTTTQTDYTLANSVISYRDILKVFSPKSPINEAMDPEFTKPKFYGINNPTFSRLSDTSDSEEMELDEVICSRKRTCLTPLDTKVKRDQFGVFMSTQTVIWH